MRLSRQFLGEMQGNGVLFYFCYRLCLIVEALMTVNDVALMLMVLLCHGMTLDD